MTLRKSTKEYWNQNWKLAGSGLKPTKVKSYFWVRLDRSFKSIFSSLTNQSLSLFEIGAGASEWLPMFSKDYGFQVSGLDYSLEGCERANQLLKEADIEGEVYLADMFTPPKTLIKKYDVVCSFGLVEHFTDTAEAISACARFLKPGGLIVTLIPNMTGLNGFFYKTLNKKVFDTHVPLTLNQLVEAHQSAGLSVYYSSYLLGLPGVIDGDRNEPNILRRWVRKCAHLISRLVWLLESKGWGIPENGFSSPYIICAARAPLA